MELLNDLIKYNNSINELPYGEVIKFAENLSERYNDEINKLSKLINDINKNYKIFGEKFSIPKKKKYIKKSHITTDINISGIKIKCPVIYDYKDTLKYPHRPCVFLNVHEWFFIAFPELGQILPVSCVKSIFEYTLSTKNTKIHYGLFNDMPLDSIKNSGFASFPFNAATWETFNKCDKSSWSKYLSQLSINQISINNPKSQKIPLFSTTGPMNNITPENMAIEWSLFVQLYFILYIFRQQASSEHFTL